jgi:YD repeat-containing protein
VGPGGGPQAIGEITTSGKITEYPLTEESPYAITEAGGNLWFTMGGVGEGRIGKITTSGTISYYQPGKGTASGGPFGITAGPENNLWFTHGNDIGKITPFGTVTSYTLPETFNGDKGGTAYDIASGPEGNLWFTVRGGSEVTNRVGIIATSGAITEDVLPKGSEPWGIAAGPDKNIWFTEYGAGVIGKIIGSPAEGSQGSPQPGSTIEYHVPVSGTGAPHEMGSSEVAKWGQINDTPTEAMAIFPPVKPMGWPAKEYERATVDYMDERGHTVNVASPSGGITTTEYNEANEVVRTLSADNRAAALKETGKTVEASELLETKSKYNGETKEEKEKEEKEATEKGKPAAPYTKLLETLGPQHAVKIAKGNEKVKSGSEVLARDHVTYSYDEGSPEGKTYDLVTKAVDSAETASKEEFDPRTTKTSYGGQGAVGWTLRQPTSVTKDAGGLNLTTTTKYEENSKGESTGNVVETKSPTGTSGGSEAPQPPTYSSQFGSYGAGSGQLHEPRSLALNSKGEVFIADAENNRIDVFSETGTFVKAFGFGVSDGKAELETCTSSCKAGIAGSGTGQLKAPKGVAIDSKGDIWVADTGNNRIEEFNEEGKSPKVFGSSGTAGGQFDEPKGIVIDSHGNVWIADSENFRIQELNEKGEFTKTFGFGVGSEKSGSENEKFEICTKSCKAGIPGTGVGQFVAPRALAVAPNGSVWVADTWNSRLEEFNEKGENPKVIGSAGTGNLQFKEPKGITIDSHNNVWISDSENDRVQELNEKGEYITQFGSKGTGNGQFQEPWGIQVDSHGNVYVSDTDNQRVQKFAPGSSGSGNIGAHDTKTAYYSSEGESEVATCRNHPEWANLPCQTEPAAQTGVSGSPELPVTTMTYNIWDEVEKAEEKFGTGSGAVIRTKTQAYDPAGRALTSEEKAEPVTDTALPQVTNEYNTETGALEKQSATIGGKVKTITSVDNTLGELEKYTDAEGNTSTYVYNLEGQVEEVNDGQAEKKGVQTYMYAPSTGYLEKLVDSSAGTFTATYDAEGKMLTEGYPNGMAAKYAYNQLGTATGIKYKKETECAEEEKEKCVWFKDAVVSTIHGETLTQSSTLSRESYAYDEAGRLTETQEIPAGKGCRSRLYSYNEESDRTSQTTRESSTETCPTEGGVVQTHSYDSANHLIDTGVKYETFGNTLTLPEADAEGHALTSAYYVDNQILNQTQNGITNEYVYDPTGRTMETKSEVKSTKVKTTSIPHYSGSGEALTWTSEEEEKGTEKTKKWTRNIPGIDGALDAIEKSGEETKPVLQIHDLQGNIVGEAADNETETKLLKTYNSTEFGVPNEGKAPPKYAWLGAGWVASEASFGTGTVTQGGASYVPQIARDLQTAPVVPPGAFPDGQGTGSEHTAEIPGWSTALANAESAATIAEYVAEQKADAEAAILGAMETEGEDPAEYLNDEEARAKAKKLMDITTLAQIVDFVSSIPDGLLSFVEGAIAEHFDGAEKAIDWFRTAGEDLLKCAGEWQVCKFSDDEVSIKFSLPSINFETWEATIVHYDWSFINLFSAAKIEGCTGINPAYPGMCFKDRNF